MRRILLVLAVAALMAVMIVATAMPVVGEQNCNPDRTVCSGGSGQGGSGSGEGGNAGGSGHGGRCTGTVDVSFTCNGNINREP